MKRDMDLVRKILLEIEKYPYDQDWIDIEIEEYNSTEITYHVMLLHEAGLIEASDLSTQGGPDWRPQRLTWTGHEFLDASRDDGRWEKAKNIMMEKSGGIAFDVLNHLLLNLMKNAVLGT